jgi:hypothetical protein
VKVATTEFDIFYLSYDEPQKEEFWAKLQEVAPWAKRVDGVKGFDSAHKACAEAAETDRFITVDGDNTVYPEFFDLELDIPPELEDSTLSWAGRNVINGLCYGNGGLKLWTRDFVLNMRTHENATRDEEKVDFCWDDRYVQLNNIYSDTWPNGSPFQAFRAGFREGVKMTLDRGEKAGDGRISKYLHDKNFKRLLIWASVGADVENGLWAIYGTRLGIYMANIHASFDIANISDYDWFKSYYSEAIAPRFVEGATEVCPRTRQRWNKVELLTRSTELLDPLRKTLGLQLADLDPAQSQFFKGAMHYAPRSLNALQLEV